MGRSRSTRCPTAGWDWLEANCAAYGLRTFRNVNDEPWHAQPCDIPAGRSHRSEPWNLQTWPLPGDPVPKPLPPQPQPTPEDDETMLRAAKNQDSGNAYYVGDGTTATWIGDSYDDKQRDLVVAGGVIDVKTCKVVYNWNGVQPIPAGQVKKYVGKNSLL